MEPEPGYPDTMSQPEFINMLIEKCEPISIRKMDYSKPVAFIYNPNSGRSRNVRDQIHTTLEKASIPFTLIETKHRNHAMEIAEELDLDIYSAVSAVGGDGTLHEVINGMLRRSDGKKLPLLLVPNGTGNDLCGSFMVDDVQTSLNGLVKGDVMEIDALKLLLDHERVEDIPEDLKIQKYRYSVINSCFTLPAMCAHAATKYKKCLGKRGYIAGSLS